MDGRKLRSWSPYLLAFAVGIAAVAVWWNVYGKTKKIEMEQRERKAKAPFEELVSGAKKLAPTRAAVETERVSGQAVDEKVQVQKDLHQIIERTNQLQHQVQTNRAEIQRILERATIHERILQTLSVPEAVRTKDQVNVERILQQEKVRLIAEQTRNIQNQLQALERAKAIQTVRTVPSKSNSS